MMLAGIARVCTVVCVIPTGSAGVSSADDRFLVLSLVYISDAISNQLRVCACDARHLGRIVCVT